MSVTTTINGRATAMRIEFVKDYRGFAPGRVVEYHPGAAEELVRRGIAAAVNPLTVDDAAMTAGLKKAAAAVAAAAKKKTKAG